MAKITKKRWQKLAGILLEGEVVSFDDYKEKKERASYQNEILITSDGKITSSPGDWVYVILTHEDQADALIDGDVEKAEQLGAKVFEVSPGHELSRVSMSESAFHFAQNDFVDKVVNQHVGGMIKDLELPSEDEQEVFSDIAHFIKRYLKKVLK